MSSVTFSNFYRDSFGVAFDVVGIDLAVANSLRRTIIADIPVVAFMGESDEPSIAILENTGPLHNEFMSHRIGLIPIHLTTEEVDAFDVDEYMFELKERNDTANVTNVTTKDFKVIKNGRELPVKETLRMFPPHPVSKHHILVTRLRPYEAFHAECKAIKATARKHAGFSAAFCTMSFLQDPLSAAQAQGVLDKERAYIRNEFNDPIAFRFQVEPYTALTPQYLVSKAFDILRSKLQKIITELYQDPSDYVQTRVWTGEDGFGQEFVFQNEDDTIGNLLQSLMYNYYILGQKPTEHGRTVNYVGYICPHPLEPIMILRIVFSEEAPLSEYIEALAESCRRIDADMQAIQTEWIRFTKEQI